MDFANWRASLKQRMDELDAAWHELDPIWRTAPAELGKDLGIAADRFHQAYWEVVNSYTASEEPCASATEEMIVEACGYVAEAWKLVARERIRRSEQTLARARDAGGPSPLSQSVDKLAEATASFDEGETAIDRDDWETAVWSYPVSVDG